MNSLANFGLILFLGLGVQLVSSETCSSPPPRHFMDLERYFGTWYMLLAGTPSVTSNPGNPNCTRHTYRKSLENPYLFDVQVSQKTDGIMRNSSGIATVQNLDIPTHYNVYIDSEMFPIDIVATDFDQYAILYMCYDRNGMENATIVWSVMGREKTLNSTVEKAILSYLEGLKIQSDELFPIFQDDC